MKNLPERTQLLTNVGNLGFQGIQFSPAPFPGKLIDQAADATITDKFRIRKDRL